LNNKAATEEDGGSRMEDGGIPFCSPTKNLREIVRIGEIALQRREGFEADCGNFHEWDGREEKEPAVSGVCHFWKVRSGGGNGTGGHPLHLALPWLLTANTGPVNERPRESQITWPAANMIF